MSNIAENLSYADYQKLKQDRLDTFKKVFKGMVATSDDAYEKINNKTARRTNQIYNKENKIFVKI